jgi:hypothetical protein
MNNWCICWFFTHILLGILIFKGLTARRLYKSFGVKGLIIPSKIGVWCSRHFATPVSLCFPKPSLNLKKRDEFRITEVAQQWFSLCPRNSNGPGNSVGIATGYGLDGPGIEKKSRWGEIFFAHVQSGPGSHLASCTMGTGSLPGLKRPGRCAEHPTPSSTEVTNG